MNPHRVWMPLVILCLAGIPSPVSPQARQNNTAPPGSCTWVGTVTIERKGAGIFRVCDQHDYAAGLAAGQLPPDEFG